MDKLDKKFRASNLDYRTRALRTNELKHWRERREGALFCHFMSEHIGKQVLFAADEAQDHDIVARVDDGDSIHYLPVQLKEVVPGHLNPNATLDDVIAALEKYRDSKDLTVAVHLNQDARIDLSQLKVPELNIGGLWVYYCTSEDGYRWSLCGDMLGEPQLSEHDYPTK